MNDTATKWHAQRETRQKRPHICYGCGYWWCGYAGETPSIGKTPKIAYERFVKYRMTK